VNRGVRFPRSNGESQRREGKGYKAAGDDRRGMCNYVSLRRFVLITFSTSSKVSRNSLINSERRSSISSSSRASSRGFSSSLAFLHNRRNRFRGSALKVGHHSYISLTGKQLSLRLWQESDTTSLVTCYTEGQVLSVTQVTSGVARRTFKLVQISRFKVTQPEVANPVGIPLA